MTELLRILADRHDGTYEAERLNYGQPAGRFTLVVHDGPALLIVGEHYIGRRIRVAADERDSGELVYVLCQYASLY